MTVKTMIRTLLKINDRIIFDSTYIWEKRIKITKTIDEFNNWGIIDLKKLKTF